MDNPHLWTPDFGEEIRALMKRGVELEYAHAEDTMPRGVLGLNATMFKEYLRFIANRRCQQIVGRTVWRRRLPYTVGSTPDDAKNETSSVAV